MRTILLKKDGNLIVKIGYDENIVEDLKRNAELMKEKKIEYVIDGFDGSNGLEENCLVVKIDQVGKFKEDRFTGETVIWCKSRVLESTVEGISISTVFWTKITRDVYHSLFSIMEAGSPYLLTNAKLLIKNPSKLRKKREEDRGEVNFLYSYGGISIR